MSIYLQNRLNTLTMVKKFSFYLFFPLRYWMDNIKVTNREFAHFLCKLIPYKCPFERDVTIFGKTFHLPALCKLNPLYNEVVSLRLRALSYLEDDCGNLISTYIS
jgi:hypothetical protein